ncbi:hypothetical protein PRIPAC_80582 [Pristionchus pacificus]|uniref:Uncharacterized protein n=1 Tax=Pristionchus pacificus TaxID=54126 RepID=A0A2A6CPT9_PRIPA|nr:hypothetical protein PRIPAC_80582 [Pristionchus pacificus]|eukprot:PDM80222.1 hypothetical protein PRIPAC_32801 [Pristionchus pacificus]
MNAFTLHPLMLYLLCKSGSMSFDIRCGFILTEIILIILDWVFNYDIPIYDVAPYGELYCGGPLCTMIDRQSIIMISSIIAASVTSSIPCYLFLLMRIHKHAITSHECLMFICIACMCLNEWGFGVFGKNKDDATLVSKNLDLQWLNLYDGKLIVFGVFGKPQYFRSGIFIIVQVLNKKLYILGFTLFMSAPVPVILTI